MALALNIGKCTLLGNYRENNEDSIEVKQFHIGSSAVHCPAGTEHVIVGAGDGPAIVLAVGARHETEKLRYPKSELAAKYDASAEEETPKPQEAYARFDRPQPGRPDSWDELP